MFYLLKTRIPTLKDGYDFIRKAMPLITDQSTAIGPMLSVWGLKDEDFFRIMHLLPNIPDYVIKTGGREVNVLYDNRQEFQRPELFDGIRIFFHQYGNIQAYLNNPYYPSPAINLNFASPVNPKEPVRGPYFSAKKRVTSTEELLQRMFAYSGVAMPETEIQKLSKTLIHDHSQGELDDGLSGYRFRIMGRDSADLSTCISIMPPETHRERLLDLFLETASRLECPLCWDADLHGDLERIRRIRTQLASGASRISSGLIGTGPFGYMLSNLAYEGRYDQWREEIAKMVLPEDVTMEILEAIGSMDYDELNVRWENLTMWITDPDGNLSEPNQNVPLDDGGITLGKTMKGRGRILFEIGDSLPRRKIKAAIESRLDVKLNRYL